MSNCNDYPTPDDAKRFKNNADSVNEFVTSDGDTFVDQDGGEHRTIEGMNSDFDTLLNQKEAEADAAIDEYRLINKGEYAAGITLENNFEFIVYEGTTYFATNPPYTTTSTTPNNDTNNLFVGGYASQEQIKNLDSRVSENESGVANLNAKVSTNESNITALQQGQQSGVIVFKTYALLTAYTPQPDEERGSFKVTNDPDLTLNGYYSWLSGTTYIKDASLVQDVIDPSNTSDAVSGSAVYSYVNPIIEHNAEVSEKVELGVNVDAEYSNYIDGTDAPTASTPQLESVGVGFTVYSGEAIADIGVSLSSPAIMLHDPKYNQATAKFGFSSNNGGSVRVRDCGAIVQYQDQSSLTFVSYNNTNGSINFNRYDGVSRVLVESSQTDLPLDIEEWVLSVQNNLDGTFTVSVDSGEYYSGEVSFNYLTTSIVNYNKPHLPAFGVFFGADTVGLRKFSVDTNESVVLEGISALEEKTPIDTPTGISDVSESVLLRGGKSYNSELRESKSILVDSFHSDKVLAFPSEHTKKYNNSKYPSGDYTVLGLSEWETDSVGIAPLVLGDSSVTYESDLSIITSSLPIGWYHKMRGVEVRLKAYMPDGDQSIVVALRYDKGEQPDDGAGTVFVRLNSSKLNIYALNDSIDDSPEYTYFDDIFSEQKTFGRDVDIVVRAYNSTGRGDVHDFIYVEADGVRGAYFFYQPIEVDTRKSTLNNITDVGFGVSSKNLDSYGVRVKEFRVNPVPAVGSSNYRSLPPMDAPVVPDLQKQGLVFDAINADENAKDEQGEILGPSIIPMLDFAEALGITPIDNYYMYYSSDHALGDGGIWLATAPDATGPWTLYAGGAGSNRIYTDTDTGTQTEQPQVVYDEYENRLIMQYHKRDVIPGSSQQTIAALSTDGVNFTRYGVVTDTSVELRRRYVNHDGYSSFCAKDPLGVVEGWIGWFRIAGGAGAEGGKASLWGVAKSNNGLDWTCDLLPVSIPSLQRPLHEQNIIHNMGYGSVPFAYQGQRLFPYAPFKAESVGSGDGYLAIVRMGDDLRNMSSDEYIVEKTLPTESGQLSVSSVFVRGDMLYMYYMAQRRYLHLITADLSSAKSGADRPF